MMGIKPISGTTAARADKGATTGATAVTSVDRDEPTLETPAGASVEVTCVALTSDLMQLPFWVKYFALYTPIGRIKV